MGIESRWEANIVFIKGMYSPGDAGEAERISMREDREVEVDELGLELAIEAAVTMLGESDMYILLM